MIELSRGAVALIALACGLWFAIATWVTLRGSRRSAVARELDLRLERASALIASGPAVPVLIADDGLLHEADAVARLLGQDTSLQSILDFSMAGLDDADLDRLQSGIARIRAGGDRFGVTVRIGGSARTLRVDGRPAPAPWPIGWTILWFHDDTESEDSRAMLAAESERLGAAVDALSALIEAAPFPMWHRGPDLSLALVNRAYVEAVEGVDAMTVVSAATELIDEGGDQSPGAYAAQARAAGAPVARTVPATVAGERRMMRVVEVPLGESGVAGYAIDVEDREQARAELGRFVRAQRDMLDRLSAGVAQFGRDRTLTFFNQPFARLFDLRSEFLADTPEFDRLLDAMRESGGLPEVRHYPEWKEERRRWFTSGLAADEEDWLLPGGKHLRVVAQPLPDGGLLTVFEDRTEQLQLASARDTLLRVRTATFDNLFEAVGVFASDGRLHLWNNRFREVWQFEEAQLAAHPRVDQLTAHLATKLKNPNHAGLVRELVRLATVERRQRGGRVSMIDGRDFEFAAVPLPDGNALFTMLDITDSRMIEAALRERNDALEEADRLKTAFVSNMSYELRTPLTSIAGFSEMLAEGYAGVLAPQAKEYVFAILESVGRLGALIDNVLDLTQSDTGSLLLAEDEVDLKAVCAEAAEAVRESAAIKTVELVVEIDPSVGLVTGDPRRLRQALDNILKNAVAYTDAGGRVLLQASGDVAEAEISVSDNGRGIAHADQAIVFDRFHRTTHHRDGEEAALGLGLPLARQFIEAHGGAVALQSEPGEGTIVTFRIPRGA